MKLHHVLCIIILNVLSLCSDRVNANNSEEEKQRPNIIIILADDLGFNDVSYHGSNQILTPNIDALAYNGIILNNHYSQCMCTPSRSALLTGKYPIHTGMQEYVISNSEPWGLPLEEKIMPEIFKDAGYQTHMIGKWHQGFFQESYTPCNRGFDTHFGYLGSHIDYFTHKQIYPQGQMFVEGYDFRRNLNVTWEGYESYATDLFNQEAVRIISQVNVNEPKPLFLYLSHLTPHAGSEVEYLQAPQEEIDKFQYLEDVNRRIFAAMVSKLDEGVGMVVEALSNNNMLENTIIVFLSDNGAPTVGLYATTGSNYPFKGQKYSPWEGGSRTVSFIWSRLLETSKHVSGQLMHLTDWLPTLATAAGIEIDNKNELDGISLWNALSHNRISDERNSVLLNIDPSIPYEAYRNGKWKMVSGSTSNGTYDAWLGELSETVDPRVGFYAWVVLNSNVGKILHQKMNDDQRLTEEKIHYLRQNATIDCGLNETFQNVCDPFTAPCLFDIEQDPCERNNLATIYPEILLQLLKNLESYRKTSLPSRRNSLDDPNANPALHNSTWTWWL